MKKDPSSVVHTETRRLAAIMFTDIVGFSRQMGRNEARTLRLLDTHNQLIQHAVAEHHGTVIKTVGDAFLVDFPSVVHAVQCAQQIQAQFRTDNAEKEPAEQTHVRVGIHSGDIVQKEGDVFGDGVNIASRLQELAAPDTICLSHVVYQEVTQKLALGTVVSLGRPKLKNIAQRELVYALLAEKPTGFRRRLQVQRLKLKPWRRLVQVATAILLLIGAGLIGRYFYIPSPAGLPFPDKPSIVVLPFTNMSGDPEQEYFNDGITEDLTSDLSKMSSLFVIARNSAFTYKGKAVKVQEVSRELGVRYVLEGSVRRANDQVRITAQLIDGTTGGHLWSERYDRPLKDIFALQDEIVQRIVAALRVEVSEAELPRVKRLPTENLNAYDSLLRGLEYARRHTKATNTLARERYRRTIKLDPEYAAAYASLGWTYLTAMAFQWEPGLLALEQAFALSQRAIALNDSLPSAHTLLGFCYLWKTRQYDQAIAHAERALSLDSNDVDAYWALANFLNVSGDPEKAIGLMERAMRLNPYYPFTYDFELGHAYYLTGRKDEAVATWKQTLVHNPNFLPAYLGLAGAYSELGRAAEARAAGAEVLKRVPNYSLDLVKQTWPYKDPADLERVLDGLRKAGLK
jgi:TolB-like protein/class 3 adenylate cyclase